MTPEETIGIAAILAALLGLIVRELHVAANERKRTQPIVIGHEHSGAHFGGHGWVAEAYLTNDGSGAAFNVRFGVEYRGNVRYAYRMEPEDDPRGNRQTVIQAGKRLPEQGVLAILLSSEDMYGAAALGVDGRLHQSRVYWCRYENARGQTWETRNPWDRSTNLDIRRRRFIRLRERAEERKRSKAQRALARAIANTEREAANQQQDTRDE